METKELVEQLEANPILKERVIQLIKITNNANGDIDLADEAERRITEELRAMGQETLQNWANRQVEKTARNAKQQKPDIRKHIKKKCNGIAPMEKSKSKSRLFINGKEER